MSIVVVVVVAAAVLDVASVEETGLEEFVLIAASVVVVAVIQELMQTFLVRSLEEGQGGEKETRKGRGEGKWRDD